MHKIGVFDVICLTCYKTIFTNKLHMYKFYLHPLTISVSLGKSLNSLKLISLFLFFNLSVVDLQCCVSFRSTVQ